jgi:hypothetical protein
MKEKVIKWLQSGCPFAEGLFLLPASGIMSNFIRICNLQGATKSNVEMLEYQLCKEAGISEKESKLIKRAPVKKVNNIAPVKEAVHISTEAVNISTEADHINTEGVHINTEGVHIPTENKETIKLREEFPFLNDPSCPNELKILVSDKISAYYNYCNGHERLFNSPTEGDIFLASRDVVENFILNRIIFEELNYYKKNKKLLMKHAIFDLMKRETEIVKMKVPDLIQLSKQLVMNIWRNQKLINKEPGSEFTKERIERVKKYEFEASVVNRLLNTK